MYKRGTVVILLFLVCAIHLYGQKAIKVRGELTGLPVEMSKSFNQSLYCYLKGDFIIDNYDYFYVLEIDSVIKGEIPNLDEKKRKVVVGILNECILLDFNEKYTLDLKQIPTTDYYYIDKLSQVSPNKKYKKELKSYRKKHQQIVNTLKKGTHLQIKEALDKTDYVRHQDKRYVQYIIPYLSCKDSITHDEIWHWDGFDEHGGTGGCDTVTMRTLFSEYIYEYIFRRLPFDMPDRTDDVDWVSWYSNLLKDNDHFVPFDYARNQSKTIIENDNVYNVIPDITNQKLHFTSHDKNFVLNLNTDEVKEVEKNSDCKLPYIRDNYSVYENEIFYTTAYTVTWTNKINDCYCVQKEVDIDELKYNIRPSSLSFRSCIAIPKNNNLLIVWGGGIGDGDKYNCLNIGEIDIDGGWVKKPQRIHCFETERKIDAFSLLQLPNKNNLIGFSISNSRNNSGTIFLKKINPKQEIMDSASFTINLSGASDHITKTYLSRKGNEYLLLVEILGYKTHLLFYNILDKNLRSKTDFVLLSKKLEQVRKPIVTRKGFMISWVDDDIVENTLRSVLINGSGKESKRINIISDKIDFFHNMEYDSKNLDIYILNKDSNIFVRKRIGADQYLKKK